MQKHLMMAYERSESALDNFDKFNLKPWHLSGKLKGSFIILTKGVFIILSNIFR